MTITNPLGTLETRRSVRPTTGPTLALAGSLSAVLVVAAVLQPSLSPDALLPAAAVLLFAAAATVALAAWQRPRPRRQFSYWDAAGVLTFIGLCAAAAVEPEQMVRLVAGTDRLH